MILIFIWAVVATFALLLLAAKYRRTFRKINGLLERMIEGQRIEEATFNESTFSLLEGQLKTISDKLEFEIGRADAEKEQMKQLISNMSHQLKTPLSNIMMYEEFLESRQLTESKRLEFMGKLKEQTEKINWLLESLFKMSKLEQNVISFEVSARGIKETIRSAVSAVYEKAEQKKIAIRVIDFSDAVLLHNPKWTSEVFENLLENAVKYTQDGGWIELSLERLETYSIIHIRDNGMGIAKDALPHVFERFYRSECAGEVEGSGIGLYLSKMILEKEKGYITVRSEPGKGSVFSVFLQNC